MELYICPKCYWVGDSPKTPEWDTSYSLYEVFVCPLCDTYVKNEDEVTEGYFKYEPLWSKLHLYRKEH